MNNFSVTHYGDEWAEFEHNVWTDENEIEPERETKYKAKNNKKRGMTYLHNVTCGNK